MKILLLADSLDNGGAETHIHELAINLSLLGHFVSVLSNGGNISEQLQKKNITQIHYGAFPLKTLYTEICRIKPDIVHAHTRKTAFMCRVLLTFMEFPFVFTAHAHFSSKKMKDSFSFFPKQTIAVSRDIAHHLVKSFGVSRDSVSIIENGINIAKFCPKRNNDRRFRIVMISRMDHDCSLGAHLLCQIAPALYKKFPDLKITLVGGGNESRVIGEKANLVNQKLQKPILTVVGQKSDVLPYLHQADLFIGVSRAALEAMACSLPVILCGNEGYLGILTKNTLRAAEETNYCARGCPKPTAKALYRDICKLFKNQEFALENAVLGLRQIGALHTSAMMVKKTLAVYYAAIADTKKKQTSDILLCGYYGYDNLGDELTLASIRTGFSDKGLHLAVLTPPGKCYKDIRSINRFHPIKLLYHIRRTGLLLFGGGSLLQNKTGNPSLLYYLSLLTTAQLLGVPTMLYAGGIGPIRGKTLQKMTLSVLKKTDCISVRDEASFAFLKKHGINQPILTSDPVLLCKIPTASRKKDHVVAVAKKEELDTLFAFLSKKKSDVRILLFDKQNDLEPSKILAKKLKEQPVSVSLKTKCSPYELITEISSASLVVSARLHACILAYLSHTPFLAISNDPKLLSFSQYASSNTSNEKLLSNDLCRQKKSVANMPSVAVRYVHPCFPNKKGFFEH